jgi:hypothetical protein
MLDERNALKRPFHFRWPVRFGPQLACPSTEQEQAMPGVDAVIWFAGAAAAVAVAILLAAERTDSIELIAPLFRVGLIAAAILGAWLYVQQRDERRALDDRKAVLMASSIAPGSALACLDELAGEAVESACEKTVFASPEAVASAVKYVAAQIELLNDGTAYAGRGDAGYAAKLVPLRKAIELDRFGLVAHVLAGREGCTAEHCDALGQLGDSTRVLANLSGRTFEEQVKKYTAIWNAPRPADGVFARAGRSVALPGANGPGTVAPSRDPAAEEPVSQSAAVTPPAARTNITSPPPQEPPLLRDSVASEPAPQSAAVVPPAALGSATSPSQEPPPPGSVALPPQEPPPLRGPAAAEPRSESAAVTAPAALGSITPLPPRRPPRLRVATPPPAAAPP